tara:strand:+ start:211 stop:396 length:186 start_codon:yes stop_codon:yes gene_type:complete
MSFKSAKYFSVNGKNESIDATDINDIKMSIPLSDENGDYVKLMTQVDAGELTIDPADNEDE